MHHYGNGTKAKNNRSRVDYRKDVREEGLKAGDFVRIRRTEGEFSKQAVPPA